MSLTTITATVTNNPYKAGIEIESKYITGQSITGISKITISRSDISNPIKEITTTSQSDFTFKFLDMSTLAGRNYTYTISLISNNAVVQSDTFQVSSTFDGMFVGDETAQYVAEANMSTSFSRNTRVEYVETLNNAYPYVVRNGDTNYIKGTSRGLFMELTSDKKDFVRDTTHAFTNQVISFLSNGNEKILKTPDGNGWYVYIDGEVKEATNDTFGVYEIEFGWIEIGAMPVKLVTTT